MNPTPTGPPAFCTLSCADKGGQNPFGHELGPLGIDEFVNKKLIHTPPTAR
jgi:hypothetical protein